MLAIWLNGPWPPLRVIGRMALQGHFTSQEWSGDGLDADDNQNDGASGGDAVGYGDVGCDCGGKSGDGHTFPNALSEPEKQAVLEYLKTL